MKLKIKHKLSQKIKNGTIISFLTAIIYLLFCIAFLLKDTFGKHEKLTDSAACRAVKNVNCNIDLKGDGSCDLSVIIPIFNGKEFISDCLNSVINQVTEYSFEIILVDDGSTDGLEGELKERELFDKIKYLRISNSGQGYARNRGLEISCGRRITFLDADDKMNEGFIQTLLSYDEDLVQCGFETFGSYDKKILHKEFFTSDKKRILKNNCFMEGYPWGKVYKRELFKKFGFPEKIHFEDNNLSYLILPEINSYRYIAKPLIGYRIHPKQETANVVKYNFGLDQVTVILSLYKLCLGKPNRDYYDEVTLYNLTTVLFSRTAGNSELLKTAFQEILNYEEIYSLNVKTFKGKKFKKTLEKKDVSRFLHICKYL